MNRPSASVAITGVIWESVAVEFTMKSSPTGLPSASNSRARMHVCEPSPVS